MTIETKLFELRDTGTFIPVIASRMRADREPEVQIFGSWKREHWLLRRAGYSDGEPFLVLLARLDGGGRAEYDPYAWASRTWTPAHDYIAAHWDALRSGDLIDSRVCLGEASAPCESEYSL